MAAITTNYPYARDLKVGDVVCTVSGNFLNLGIFAGLGNGTFQIYFPGCVKNWDFRRNNGSLRQSRPRVAYSKSHETNIVKVDINSLDDEHRKEMEEAIQILTDRNIILKF